MRLISYIILSVLTSLLVGCATTPGPPVPYMADKFPLEIMIELDEAVTEFGNYPRMPGFEGCEDPAKLVPAYVDGSLEVNKVGISRIAEVCMCGLSTEVKAFVYAMGGPVPVFGCITYDSVKDCKPIGAKIFYVDDSNNAFETHEYMHYKGFGDDFYPAVEWDESKCEGIR